MSIKTILLGLAAVVSVSAPGVAAAQSYGYGYNNYGSGYYGNRYDDRGGYHYDRHERHRWEARRRWEERERRREWERAHRYHGRYDGYDRGYYR